MTMKRLSFDDPVELAKDEKAQEIRKFIDEICRLFNSQKCAQHTAHSNNDDSDVNYVCCAPFCNKRFICDG